MYSGSDINIIIEIFGKCIQIQYFNSWTTVVQACSRKLSFLRSSAAPPYYSTAKLVAASPDRPWPIPFWLPDDMKVVLDSSPRSCGASTGKYSSGGACWKAAMNECPTNPERGKLKLHGSGKEGLSCARFTVANGLALVASHSAAGSCVGRWPLRGGWEAAQISDVISQHDDEGAVERTATLSRKRNYHITTV